MNSNFLIFCFSVWTLTTLTSFVIHTVPDFFFLIEVYLIYSVVLVSGVQQSEQVIHIHISILFQILFPYRSLQSIEQTSLCYTVVSPYQFSILYIVVCICQSQSSNLSLPSSLTPGNHKFVLYICNSNSVSQISSFVHFSQIPHISDIT